MFEDLHVYLVKIPITEYSFMHEWFLPPLPEYEGNMLVYMLSVQHMFQSRESLTLFMTADVPSSAIPSSCPDAEV